MCVGCTGRMGGRPDASVGGHVPVGVITQHFGTELHSTSNPSSSEIFKHRLPTDQNSNPYPYHHHRTAYISSHSIIMLSPYSEMSFFEDPSDIEMDDLSLLKRPIQIKKSLRSIRSAFKHDRTPVKEIPAIPQLALYDNSITPKYSYRPSLPSTSTTQATVSSGRRHFRDRNGNTICRHRGPRSPVLLDHLPDG